ncbi:acyl-CoA dehydrogenase [Nocardioides sp. Root1257]|uniref:acyl-CoA dehydrogenase family protein n=1 Tax=unclassified Nocardioides TaxID=2615069 RepID=UPI0006F8911E|nr:MULTISPECIES: acyl-CoA dehydrogenase family protein [unclassified Nocardioides]KQW47707.1 acyl-CoA dehydrogenase [Nocardioides sp. Root1257]KRC44959.1 acyl-CoA dehydrogenase [Nocardioides sp. Root224]
MTSPDSTQPSFDLGQDHLDLRDWVHQFAADVVRPAASEWDEKEEFPWPVLEEAAKAGLYSVDFIVAQAVDETGLGFPITMEELFWGDAGIGLSIVGTSLAAAGVRANGTDEQVAEWVPQMFGTPGDLKLGAFCSSEPDAGSDVGAMRTRATYDEATDEWVLTGTKTWATNGGIADVHVVTAVVDPDLRTRGQASFVVPPGTKGLSQGQKFHKHGIRASHTAEVVLDDVRVPGRCLLGGKEKLDARLARARDGSGARGNASMATFERTRPAVGAQAIGIARAAYEVALDYAKTREQFGKPIIENQAIAFKLADMATSIEASRLLVWRAAWMARQGKKFEKAEGSMSKLFAGETAVKVTTEAMQILGGNGFTREYPVERFSRDAKIYTIFEGTSEIQRLVIARSISGAPIR